MRISDWSSDVCSSDLTFAQRRIRGKIQLRNMTQTQTLTQFMAQLAGGAIEPLECILEQRVVAEQADADARIAQVWRDVDLGHGHPRNTRIGQLAANQHRQLAP